MFRKLGFPSNFLNIYFIINTSSIIAALILKMFVCHFKHHTTFPGRMNTRTMRRKDNFDEGGGDLKYLLSLVVQIKQNQEQESNYGLNKKIEQTKELFFCKLSILEVGQSELNWGFKVMDGWLLAHPKERKENQTIHQNTLNTK